MLLANADVGNLRKRLAIAATLATGTLAWMIASRIFTGDARYFLTNGWAWPADSMAIYGSGSFFSYINRIPVYGGIALFPLFLLGLCGLLRWPWLCAAGIVVLASELIVPASVRETVLPFAMLAVLGGFAWVWRREKIAIAWWAFLLVLSLHSVLWWRGWFASAGLLRILACVSPVFAMICLRGWNQLQRAPLRVAAKRVLTIALFVVMPLTAINVYALDPAHYHVFGYRALAAYAMDHHLLQNAPKIIVRDPIAEPELGIPPQSRQCAGLAPRSRPRAGCPPVRAGRHHRILGRSESKYKSWRSFKIGISGDFRIHPNRSPPNPASARPRRISGEAEIRSDSKRFHALKRNQYPPRRHGEHGGNSFLKKFNSSPCSPCLRGGN